MRTDQIGTPRRRRVALARRAVVASVLCVLQCAGGISQAGETPATGTIVVPAAPDSRQDEVADDNGAIVREMMVV